MLFFVLLLLGVTVVFIVLLKKANAHHQNELLRGLLDHRPTGKKYDIAGDYYWKKPLTAVEQVAYWRLVEAFDDKVVLAQVAFSQFLKVHGKREGANFAKFAKARQKVADFLICNKDFSIYAIIEVDDGSHDAEKDKARDKITEEAGIPTFRIEAKVLPSPAEIKAAVERALQTKSEDTDHFIDTSVSL